MRVFIALAILALAAAGSDCITDKSTPNRSQRYYHKTQLGSYADAVTFTVKARNDAHFGFIAGNEYYEIVLGGWGNRHSKIRRGRMNNNAGKDEYGAWHYSHAKGDKANNGEDWLLNGGQGRTFWASAINGKVMVGKGSKHGQNTLMAWQDPNPLNPDSFAVMTGWGASGVWSVCNVDHTDIPHICDTNGHSCDAKTTTCVKGTSAMDYTCQCNKGHKNLAYSSPQYRLSAYPRGKIEIKHEGDWHQVCGHYFWDNHYGADQACKEMGYKSGARRGGTWRSRGMHLTRHTNPKASFFAGKCRQGEGPADCSDRPSHTRHCWGGQCNICAKGDVCDKAGTAWCGAGNNQGIEIECTGQRDLAWAAAQGYSTQFCVNTPDLGYGQNLGEYGHDYVCSVPCCQGKWNKADGTCDRTENADGSHTAAFTVFHDARSVHGHGHSHHRCYADDHHPNGCVCLCDDEMIPIDSPHKETSPPSQYPTGAPTPAPTPQPTPEPTPAPTPQPTVRPHTTLIPAGCDNGPKIERYPHETFVGVCKNAVKLNSGHFHDPGAKCGVYYGPHSGYGNGHDFVDHSRQVRISGDIVDDSKAGTYTIEYTCDPQDSEGFIYDEDKQQRIVTVA